MFKVKERNTMFETYTDDELIHEKFYSKSKISSLNSLYLQEFTTPIERAAMSIRVDGAIEHLIENDLPAYVAVAAREPDVLEGLYSDDIKSNVKTINQQLDQEFGASTDSFAQRKEVVERVFHFHRMVSAGLVPDATGDDVLRNTINHPDEPTRAVRGGMRALMNNEVEKYDFSTESAINLHNSVLTLRENIFQEMRTTHFLFTADVGEDIMMRQDRENNGTIYERGFLPSVAVEIGTLRGQANLITQELASRYPTNTMIVEDRAANGTHPGVIGYERNDRDRAIGR